MPKPIFILNGPNLNLLGKRQPEIYGRDTLEDVERDCAAAAADHGLSIRLFQSNHEGVIIDTIHQARDEASGIIINPGAFTHTSVAIRDALAAVALPFIEIHLSNPHAREPFRHTSYFSDKAVGVVCGFGADSYRYALDAALQRLPA